MIYSLIPPDSPEMTFHEIGIFDEIEKWNRANQDSQIKKYKNNMLTDEEYESVKYNLNIMRIAYDYKEYKDAFNRFCYFCHIVPRGVILTKYELKKGKDNKHSLYVEYTYNTKRIDLPAGTILYHMSRTAGIKELIPQFRGKSDRGYMYEKPRVYFTIRKKMPKAMADYKGGEKMHMYTCKGNFKNVFVDPLLWGYASGAVYVESNKPIKVEEIDPKTAKILSNNYESIDESFDFDKFFGFVTENGLILAESE